MLHFKYFTDINMIFGEQSYLLNIMQYILVDFYRRFDKTYCIHLYCRKQTKQQRSKKQIEYSARNEILKWNEATHLYQSREMNKA
jgi:hypothetical protein